MEWLNSADRFYTLVVGVAGLLALAFRIIYQLGTLIESFRKHVKESDADFAAHDARITYLERMRRR